MGPRFRGDDEFKLPFRASGVFLGEQVQQRQEHD